jgi:hypothetical protein
MGRYWNASIRVGRYAKKIHKFFVIPRLLFKLYPV